MVRFPWPAAVMHVGHLRREVNFLLFHRTQLSQQ